MKKYTTYLIFGLFAICSLKAQIKIGDNPQNLDPASVLELESSSRVLVITRMNTTQMESTSPLHGAVVYNTDTECVHFFDGALWVNLCDRPDIQTFTADPVLNANPTIVITQTDSNFNFEVGLIRGENIVPTSINGQVHIQEESITGGQIQDGSITFDKLGIGTTSGELLQWNGTQWILVDESALSVTEVDGVVGNEVTGPADATLVLSGTGDDLSPFLLDVNTGGIDTPELADNAVTSTKILDGEVNNADLANDAVTNDKMANDAVGTNELIDDGVTADKINANVAGTGLNQAADGSLEVDVTAFTGDGDITSPDGTITLGGTTTNSLFEDVSFDVADDAITNAKMADNAIGTTEIMDDAITAAKINLDVAGTGLNQAADGSLEVDNLNILPDWTNITNIPAGFADNTDDDTIYTAGTGLTLTGTTFSVDDTGIAPDWTNITNIPAGFADDTDDDTTYTAGTGLTLTGTTFSVDDTGIAPDWTNITNIPAGFADDTDDDTTYTAGTGLTLTGTTFSVDDTGIAPDWTNITNIPAGFADDTDDDTQLTDAQVATAVNSEFPNLDTDVTDDFSGDFNDLTNVPANLDTDSTDDFDGAWGSLTGVPVGFADNTDDDTQLTDAQVATAVNNEFPNLDTDVTDDFDGAWGSLTGVPVGFADNTDDDTQLTDAQVATAVNNEFPNLDTDVTDDFDGAWGSLTGVPVGFADNTDDDTQLTDAQVATAVNNEFPNLDTDVTDDFDGAWGSLTGVPVGFADNTDDDTTYTAGAGLTLTGTTFAVDNLSGDITGATNATVIADNAVTLAKLADGTTQGQLMEWNGTDWVLTQQVVLKSQIAAGAGVAGSYTINDPSITATSIIQLTVEENNPGNPIMIQLTNQGPGTFTVQVYEFILGTPTATNANWHYVVIAP